MCCDPSAAGLLKLTLIVRSATASAFESTRNLYETFGSPCTWGTFVPNGRSGSGPCPMLAAEASPFTFMIRTVLLASAGDWNP